MKYPMIEFYKESISGKSADTTADHAAEVLERIFNQLSEKYGVKLEQRRITGVNGETLQRWFNAEKSAKKAATVNNYICMLNPFLRWAATMSYDDGVPYIDRDYSKVLHTLPIPHDEEIPEWEQGPEKYYTHEQVKELLKMATGSHKVRDRAIVALILASGLRVSELCSLTLGSVLDRQEGTVYVKRKGGKYKTVYVAPFAYEYIREYLKERDLSDHSAPLFMTERGMACSRKQIYKSLAPKQEALGLATGAHALRHTFVSETEKIGGGAVARDLANHSTLRITNRYDHSTESQRVNTVNSLNWLDE